MAVKYLESRSAADCYIAGLWWNNFVDHLLWYHPKPLKEDDERRRQIAYQAPSWL